MKKIVFITFLIFTLSSCKRNDNGSGDDSKSSSPQKIDKQLNISVLWDLSDRINPAIHDDLPSNSQRDVQIIKYFDMNICMNLTLKIQEKISKLQERIILTLK